MDLLSKMGFVGPSMFYSPAPVAISTILWHLGTKKQQTLNICYHKSIFISNGKTHNENAEA